MTEQSRKARTPPVSIPLSFDDAVDGLLRVNPKKLPESAKKKPAHKNAPAKPVRAKKPKGSAG